MSMKLQEQPIEFYYTFESRIAIMVSNNSLYMHVYWLAAK